MDHLFGDEALAALKPFAGDDLEDDEYTPEFEAFFTQWLGGALCVGPENESYTRDVRQAQKELLWVAWQAAKQTRGTSDLAAERERVVVEIRASCVGFCDSRGKIEEDGVEMPCHLCTPHVRAIRSLGDPA